MTSQLLHLLLDTVDYVNVVYRGASLSVTVQVFTEGYTNKLIGCSVSPNDVVLIRIYGYQTDLLIDRDKERNSMVILHAVGCAAPLYCQFNNGIAYGYVPGVVLNVHLVKDPVVRR